MKGISGLNKASQVLSKQRANVVLDKAGFRRGVIPLSVSKGFVQRTWDAVGREALFALRGKSPKVIRKAFEKFFDGTHSLLASFKAQGIPATYDFLKVLLVAPYSGKQLSSLDRIQPQKGLERIAYYLLRSLSNVDVMVYNPNLLSSEEIFTRPEMKRFDILGFGTLDPLFDETAALIVDFNRRYPGSLKVLGGIAASHMDPHKVFRSLPVDLIVRGAGEKAMKSIVENFKGEGDLSSRFEGIQGLVINEGSFPRVIFPAFAEGLDYDQYKLVSRGDFEDIPLRRPDRLHKKSYWTKTVEHRGTGSLRKNDIGKYIIRLGTSEYCRRRCLFCSAVAFKKGRGRDFERQELKPEDIVELMKAALKQYPETDSFHFDDDDFTSNKERIKELCGLIIKSGLVSYPKIFKSRVDNVEPELLWLMKKAGFNFVSYGVESFSERILKEMDKGIDLEKIEEVLDLSLSLGFMTNMNLILFSPTATVPEILFDIKKSIEYFNRGAFVFVNSRMGAYHGAPIMSRKEWIEYKEVFHQGMKGPISIPTDVKIQNDDARALYERSIEVKKELLERLQGDPKYKIAYIPFIVEGLALFYGVYVAAGKPEAEVDEIYNLIIEYIKGKF